jgi:ATP-dependent DNA helicase RecG
LILISNNKESNERQVKAIQYIHENKVITTNDYLKIVSEFKERTLRKDLNNLVKNDMFISIGETKGRSYKLNYNSAILL